MRVVIDTNVVVSRYLAPRGTAAQVVERWQEGAFDLLVSEPILNEYGRVLQYDRLRRYHRLTDAEVTAIIEDFRELAVPVEPEEALQARAERSERIIEEDPEDDKFIECALTGGAEYVVSGDHHLRALGEYRGVRILAPAAFIAFLNARERDEI